MASNGISSKDVIKLFTTIRLVVKSLSLKSYKIFHPSGPNFLLSKIIAWKRHKLNVKVFYSSDSPQFITSRIFFMFDFMPLGGSLVILILF
jgi:hypothetical protein